MTRNRPTTAIDVSRKEAKTPRKDRKTGFMQSLNSWRLERSGREHHRLAHMM